MRWFVPFNFLPRVLSTNVGPIVTAISIGLFLWAVYTMRAENASIPTSEPTDFIVGRGPFKFSRNPIYLSMLLLQVAIGIWTNCLWFFGLAAIAAVLLGWGVISREESYLERKFGSEYLDYNRRVRRIDVLGVDEPERDAFAPDNATGGETNEAEQPPKEETEDGELGSVDDEIPL